MYKWIIARLKEKSTWKGLIYILAACGVVLTDAQVDQVIAMGLTLAGFLEVFTKDKKVEE